MYTQFPTAQNLYGPQMGMGMPGVHSGQSAQMQMMMALMNQMMQMLMMVLSRLVGAMPHPGQQQGMVPQTPDFGQQSQSPMPSPSDFLGNNTPAAPADSGGGQVDSGQDTGGGGGTEAAEAPEAPAAPAAEESPRPRRREEEGEYAWVHPSDVKFYNAAREHEKKKAQEEGRTVQIDGQWVHPSDVKFYNAAREHEKKKAKEEGRTVKVDGKYVHPSDVKFYNAARDHEKKKAQREGRTARVRVR